MRVLQDLQHAWRSVYKNPGLACFAIASLVLGVGVNTAIFSLVYGVLLRDLPLHDARLVVQVQGTSKLLFNYPQFRAMRQQSMIFADAVGMSTAPAVVELGADSQRIDAEFVTGDYFSFFESKAEIGRLLNEDDDRTEGAQPVCVLSDQEWRVRFEGDPRILGRFVRVNTVPLQVIGVVAPNFAGASLQKKYDLWIPTAMLRQLENESRDNPFSTGLQVLAKLKTGVSMTQALGLLKAASPRIEASLPAQGVFSGETYQVIAASKGLDDWRSELGRPLCLLMATVGVVLLIACANLTNLLLARATARQREFAVKISLGIGRARLARQLLIESLLLTLTGGLIGIWTASQLLKVLLSIFNMGQIESLDVAISTPVIWFTFAISMITGLVIGAYPSWSASRTDTMPALIGFSRQDVSSRFVSKLLIVAQVSLSLALMVSAMLFGSSLGKLRRVNLGYDIDHVATVSIVPRLIKDTPQVGPPMVQLSSNFEDFMAKLRHLPGVEAAAFSFPGVLQGFAMSGPVNALDHTGATIGCSFLMASPDYFSTLRIPLLQGREFAHTDRVGSPMVAILNRRAAALLWPGEAPVGRRFDSVISKAVEVIGVVADTKYQNIREATEPIIYLSAYQMPVMAVSVALRTRLGMTQVERKSQKLLRSTSPSFQISNVTTLDMTRDGLLAQDRLLSLLFSLFGSLGTAMAIVGIYGLIAHAVTTRTHEIGIRMSVGATRSNILTLFLREAFTLLSCGIVIGLLLAGFAGRVAAALLYEIRPTDLGAYAGAVALVLAAGLTSAIVPAVRAMKINPTEALRYE